MQLNYKPDGWLGLVLGSKIFIDFMKYPFEESFAKLKHELKEYVRFEHVEPPKQTTPERPQQIVNLDEWRAEQVGRWLDENKISPLIAGQLASFDGPMLKELAIIQHAAPDSFFAMFTAKQQQQLSVHHLVSFSKALRKLNAQKPN